MQSSTDFTSIENLIAKADNQVQQKQTGYYGTQNGHRQKIPVFYIVPVFYPAYHPSIIPIHRNAHCTLSTSTKNGSEQVLKKPVPQLKSKKVQKKIKQKRKPFNFEQIARLSERFEKSNNIDTEEKKELAKKVGLTPAQVRVWFQTRRSDEARQRTIKRHVPYSVDQLALLEDRFARSKYIDKLENIELAKKTKLSEKQIREWFYRRRNAAGRAEENAKVQ